MVGLNSEVSAYVSCGLTRCVSALVCIISPTAPQSVPTTATHSDSTASCAGVYPPMSCTFARPSQPGCSRSQARMSAEPMSKSSRGERWGNRRWELADITQACTKQQSRMCAYVHWSAPQNYTPHRHTHTYTRARVPAAVWMTVAPSLVVALMSCLPSLGTRYCRTSHPEIIILSQIEICICSIYVCKSKGQ